MSDSNSGANKALINPRTDSVTGGISADSGLESWNYEMLAGALGSRFSGDEELCNSENKELGN